MKRIYYYITLLTLAITPVMLGSCDDDDFYYSYDTDYYDYVLDLSRHLTAHGQEHSPTHGKRTASGTKSRCMWISHSHKTPLTASRALEQKSTTMAMATTLSLATSCGM